MDVYILYILYIYIYIYIILYIYILYYIILYIYIIYIYIYMQQDGAAKLFQWFSENQAKGNTNVITKDESSEIHIGECIIKSSDCEKLLNIKTDSKLHF